MNEVKQKRAMLNTTINENVLSNFREYCKMINVPMNTVLEVFMKSFANGEFSLRLKKNNIELDLEE